MLLRGNLVLWVFEGIVSSFDGNVDVGFGGFVDGVDDFFGGGVDDFKGFFFDIFDEFVVDEVV